MEVTNALLVAMMFIVLLTMGIGNIIMALAALIDKRSAVKGDSIHTSWVLLLLLIHFNLFWHVLDILSIEEWVFIEFLYIVAGAVVIFFATQILLPDASSETTDVREHFFDSHTRFFGLLGLLMLWSVGVDVLFGDGLTSAGITNLVAFVFFAILALSSQPGLHKAGTAVGWLIFVGVIIARGLGYIG
jgi:hypothetical protein